MKDKTGSELDNLVAVEGFTVDLGSVPFYLLNTDLQGADLSGVDLSGVDLSGVEVNLLHEVNLSEARFLGNFELTELGDSV